MTSPHALPSYMSYFVRTRAREEGRTRTSAKRPVIAGAQSGFTLVELIVVMVIVGILLAIIIPTFLSAKHTARLKETISAATAYKQSISSFALDHGNRVPGFGAGLEWPTPGPGPVDLQVPPKPYFRSGAPDPIDRLSVDIGLGPTGCLTCYGHIRYVVAPPVGASTVSTLFRLEVYQRRKLSDPWPATPNCRIGNDGSETGPGSGC